MADLSLMQKNALTLLQEEFAMYGLGNAEFVNTIRDVVVNNTDANGNIAAATAAFELRQTDVYKARFAGNELRRQRIQQDMAKGIVPTMSELSEASYIQLEDSYREALKKYNVPDKFYDDTSYLAKMIGNDLSTSEVTARASLAQQAASAANPEVKAQLKAFYGVGEDQIAGFFLDPTLGKENIDTIAAGNAAIIAASAQRSGLQLTQQQAETIAQTSAPDKQTALSASEMFAQTSATAGLAATSVTGEAASVSAQDVVLAATGNAEKAALLEKERQRRLAAYQGSAGSELGRTATGGIGLSSLQVAGQ